MKRLAGMTLLALTIGNTTGCSWLWGSEGYLHDRSDDYLNAQQTAPMRVPEGMQSKPTEPLLYVPLNVPVSSQKEGEFEVPRPQTLSGLGVSTDFSLQERGDQRWLVAQRAPAEVWPAVYQYFQNNGFAIAEERQQTGEFSTHWQSLQQLSPLLASRLTRAKALEAGTEVRLRVRVEPGVQSNSSEVYLLSESRPVGSTASADWPSNSSLPDLDAALFKEMQVGISLAGDGQPASASLLAASAAYDTPGPAVLGRDGSGNPVLTLDSDLDRAWVSIGRALEGADVRVDDLNRSLGVYYVNIAAGAKREDEPGLISRVFGGSQSKEDEEAQAQRYQVRLTPAGERVQVTVDKDINTAAPVDVAQTLLEKLQQSMGDARSGNSSRYGLGERL